MPLRARVQKQPRSLDRIAAHGNRLGALKPLDTVGDEPHSDYAAGRIVDVNPGDHASIADLTAMLDRVGEVRDQR